MRILALSTWFPSAEDPAQAPFNLKHVEAIALRHDVTVIHVRLGSTLAPKLEEYGGFTVLRLSFSVRRFWRGFGLLRQLRQAIAGVDLVHTMAFSSALVVAPAMAFRKRLWVHTEHWNGVMNPASVSKLWTRMAWTRRILSRPDWLTGVSTQLAATLAVFGRCDSTSVVPCVIENPLPLVARPQGPQLRLIAVGGLMARKQPLLAVQTVKWLVDQGHDVSMTWVGDGPQRALVESECERLDVVDRISITGFVTPAHVFDYFQDADIFYLPTRHETFFASAAEALAAGRPVVVTRMSAYGDYLDDHNGVLVDEMTPEGFGRAILQARERFATVSVEEIASPIRERFSLARVGEQFEDIYVNLTSGTQASEAVLP